MQTPSRSSWLALLDALFPGGIPPSAEWSDLSSIRSILNQIAPHPHQFFYPVGGSQEFQRADKAAETGCLALVLHAGEAELLKPRTLVFDSMEGDPSWAYFLLELAPLEPTPIYSDPEGLRALGHEELVEIRPGQYRDRVVIDQGFLDWDEHGDPVPLPAGTRIVDRWLSGFLVIADKYGPYNLESEQFDAAGDEHYARRPAEFSNHIRQLKRMWESQNQPANR